MRDLELGELDRVVDTWIGDTSWEFPCSGTTHVRLSIRSSERGPTAEQRELFREIRSRYQSLWPDVARKLLVLQPSVRTAGDLATALEPRLLLFIPGVVSGEGFDFVLGYEFTERETPTSGCFVGFRGWEIADAFKAS